jgi:hypothetical protein
MRDRGEHETEFVSIDAGHLVTDDDRHVSA